MTAQTFRQTTFYDTFLLLHKDYTFISTVNVEIWIPHTTYLRKYPKNQNNKAITRASVPEINNALHSRVELERLDFVF